MDWALWYESAMRNFGRHVGISLGVLILCAGATVAHALPEKIPAKLTAPALLSGATADVPLTDVTVAVFLSTRCPCSQGHETALKALARTYGPKGVRFVGIHSNADESLAEARAYFEKAAFPFQVLQDEGAKIADTFDALKTPHVFVVKNGEVVYSGGMDNSHLSATASEFYLSDVLEDVLGGRTPRHTNSRTLGCVIKRP